MILEYARRGCESVQLLLYFQLPLSEYPATDGSRTRRALHALVFDPHDGIIAGMLELEEAGRLERRGGMLHSSIYFPMRIERVECTSSRSTG